MRSHPDTGSFHSCRASIEVESSSMRDRCVAALIQDHGITGTAQAVAGRGPLGLGRIVVTRRRAVGAAGPQDAPRFPAVAALGANAGRAAERDTPAVGRAENRRTRLAAGVFRTSRPTDASRTLGP